MNDIKVLSVGGSRNIGYYASLRLLKLGATVTFLLRSPSVFNDDAAIQPYVSSGKARLVKGNALVREDVERAWTEAAKGDDNRPVDFLIFTIGGTPRFSISKGFVISPPNLVTQALLNCLETLPTPAPKIIVISSTGLTRASHNNLPLLLKPLYGYLLRVPHKDKCGVEEVLAHCVGWPWEERDSPGPEILGPNWKERVPGDGQLKSNKQAYRVNEGDLSGSYTVSRKDVAHFVVEGVIKDWDTWQGKRRDLLPLSASLSEPDSAQGEAVEKSIGLIQGIGLIVGLQIGSGIFSSPGVVVANTHSVGASLTVWLASGLLAWTGASSFAELGSSIPLNGGAQAYLGYAYGPLVSYLFAWTVISALKPGSNALISLIFAEYINRVLWHTTRGQVSPDDIPPWAIKLTAVAAILLVTFLCAATRNMGTRAAVMFTSVKIVSLMSITVIGLVQLIRGRVSPSFKEPPFEGSSTSPSAYSLALYSGLWALDGWDQANYVGGEMQNPERNIPRAIHWSMFIVLTLFLLANVSYFVVLDKQTVGLSNTVALDFGQCTVWSRGSKRWTFVLNLLVYQVLPLPAHAWSLWQGREGYLPAVFGKLHKSRKTPVNAILLQAGLSIAFILIGGGFRSLINFSVVASWAFYFLTVLGLIILRVKEPNLERPYRTWIVTPLTFCAVALFLLCMPIIAAPLEAAAVLGFVLAGVPVYYLTNGGEQAKLLFLMSSVGSWLSRLFGWSRASDGWQAVSQGDEVEMFAGHVLIGSAIKPGGALSDDHRAGIVSDIYKSQALVELPNAFIELPRVTSKQNRLTMTEHKHTYRYQVKMSCGGCSGAVSRALDKLKGQGVDSYQVSLEKQEVTVRGTAEYDFVLEKIKKTGKEVVSGHVVSEEGEDC
ncbi:amino acid permease-domain-containing protein [Pisolithus sp. B1]|nr:amino acid permease-domain-containing protein [Pisolithus sp. B1]